MPCVARTIIALWAGWLLATGSALAGSCLDDATRQAQLSEQDTSQLLDLQARHGTHTPSLRSRVVFEHLLEANQSAVGTDPGADQGAHRPRWQLAGYGATAINAHAMHAGTVVISQALDAPELPEPLLAAALAHEIAHVLLHHGLQQACFALQALQDARAGTMPQVWSSAEGPGQRLRTLMQSHELQADARAIEWLQRAGYPAHSLSDLLQFLAARQPPAPQAAAKRATGSHPAQDLRIMQALQVESLSRQSATSHLPRALVHAGTSDTQEVERSWQVVAEEMPHAGSMPR